MSDGSLDPLLHSRPLRSWFVWRPAARWLLRGTILAVVVLVVGNATILGLHGYAAATRGLEPPTSIDGLGKLRAVDERVWRGNAPDEEAYVELAAAGVTDVVDLRAERDLDVPDELLDELGVTRHHLPIRDGQTPEDADVARFLDIVDRAPGLVYLHCGAGVGRTGAMTAAYLVQTGQAGPRAALSRNLAVGPPSIEQIWYAAGFDTDDGEPPAAVKWASRFLDGPRRLWSRYGL